MNIIHQLVTATQSVAFGMPAFHFLVTIHFSFYLVFIFCFVFVIGYFLVLVFLNKSCIFSLMTISVFVNWKTLVNHKNLATTVYLY